MSKPNRELIKMMMLMMLAELKKPKQPKKSMTTEELADAVSESITKMTPLEKAHLRRILRKEFRSVNLYKRVQ